VKTAETNYLLYLNKREEAHISDAFDRNRILNVSIAQPATIPFLPTNPVPLTLVLGWLVACLVSMGIVFVQDRLDPQVLTPRQIERYLEVPILAQLPNQESVPDSTVPR
jgi:capsular polysaccharide biosynthesis protein